MTYDLDSRPGMNYFGAFFILLGLMGAGMIIGSLAGAGIWVAMTGTSLLSMEKEMQNPSNVQAVRILQLVSTFFMFFLPAFFTALILNRRPSKFLGFNFYFSGKQILVTIAIMLAALPLVGALAELNKHIPLPDSLERLFKQLSTTYEKQVLVLSKISGLGDYLYALIVMALGPAIFEETFFRGGFQNILTRWTLKPWLSIIITSVIFSLIHVEWTGFLSRIALGMLLGMIYYYSGSLWLAIVAHFFNNALIVTTIYYYTLKGKSFQEAMNETTPIWTGIVAALVVYGLFYLFRKFAASDRITKFPPEVQAEEDKWMV